MINAKKEFDVEKSPQAIHSLFIGQNEDTKAHPGISIQPKLFMMRHRLFHSSTPRPHFFVLVFVRTNAAVAIATDENKISQVCRMCVHFLVAIRN